MFNCGKCGGVTPPGTKTRPLVVEERDVFRRDGEGKRTEIVRQIDLCPECALAEGFLVVEEERLHCSQFRYQRQQEREAKALEKARRAHS